MNKRIKEITAKKIESEGISKLLTNRKYNDRLANCSNGIDEYTDGSYSLFYPCKVHFCPLCTFLKVRKEYAISCQVYDKLIRLKPTAKLYLMTLTIEECPGHQIKDAVKLIKDSFNRLIRIKRIDNVLLGASLSIHFGMNRLMMTPHAHVVLALKPSFVGKQYIKIDDFQALWQSALKVSYLPYVHLQPIGKTGVKNAESNRKEFARASAYGVGAIDFQDIKNNTKIFNEIIEEIKGIRKVTHTGLLKELRKLVADDYKASKVQENKDVEFQLRFKDKAYQRLANPLLVAEDELGVVDLVGQSMK